VRAKSPPAVRLHVGLAYTNLLLATLYGLLLAINKKDTFLPLPPQVTVFGHAHLAAVGWATLMVVGVGHRLLPMFLPAAPATGISLWASVLLLEAGTLGLATAFLIRGPTRLFAVLIAAGLAVFLFDVIRMRSRPRPPPPGLRRPDPGMLHALQSFFYLLLAAGVGLGLAFSGEWHPAWIMVYGVFGLVGFLSQIVLGIGMRLFPMFAWKAAWVGSDFKALPPPPHEMPARPLQVAGLGLWTVGTPLLALGLGADLPGVITAGAWALFGAAVLGGCNAARVLRHAFASRPPRG
ncbi:MAG: hypothetical protein ACE5JG_10335, partial [Planctomycetota bacterium]